MAESGAQPEVVIDCRGLDCGYGQTVIVEDVNLSVSRGEVVAILGGSGSGKSTLLRTVVGLEAPITGEVDLFGEPLRDEDEEVRPEMLHDIGMLFQQGALFGSMSVLENVMFPLKEQSDLPHDLAEELARTKLRQVRLERFADQSPSRLSGGQQTRVALARATVFDPGLLFCDEPSAGLDPVVASELDEMLLELRDTLGVTIVVVTHELTSLRRIADRAVMLHDGRIVDSGPLEQLEREGAPATRRFFGAHEGSPSRPTGRTALDLFQRSEDHA